MFHLYITLAYIIPNIYLFFRIKDLFISRAYRRWYIFLYLLMAAIYPLSERLSHQEPNLPMQLLSTISGYILPFYLYLFLSVLLFDLLLLLNLLFRLVPSDTRKTFSFRFYTLSAMIILSIAVVVAGAINLNTIRVSEYRVEVPRRHSKTDHLRVAFVADIHIQQNTSLRYIEQLVRKINALQPDLMLYGGDMTEGDRENETTEAIESVLRNIHAKYGVFGVTGNHEFYGGKEQGGFFRKAGITLLCDTMMRINNSIYLAGRYDQHFGRRKTITGLLGTEPPDLPVILLDHRPIELKKTSLTAVDVQFSGHTHHGQMFPINLITQCVYELSWGYKKIRKTHFFVTSGLRLWGPPVKTAGKSEIMQVDICFK
jgi:predicted MPP superfamily phosphohydrolase